MTSVICNYRTSNDNRFYHDSASDISGKVSIRLDEELSAVEMMAAMAASKMAAIRLLVQGVAAGGMSAWLAG
jgi:GDP-D-mannose dehydratase